MVQSYHIPELDTWQSPKKVIQQRTATRRRFFRTMLTEMGGGGPCADSIGENGRQGCCQMTFSLRFLQVGLHSIWC